MEHLEKLKRLEPCFKTSRCCCGCTDLRKGAIIWAWIDIIGGILAILGFTTYFEFFARTGIFMAVVGIITSCCFLYGVVHNKPALLLPAVISLFVTLVLIPFYMLGVLIFGPGQSSEEGAEQRTRIEALLILLVAALFFWHKAAVFYTMYKTLNEEGTKYGTNVEPQSSTQDIV